ncbi:hypothetical protein jaqu_31140 [Jannaschia aquimarina]|uniref:Uncharacterized protein n=1 Tax=Jannaschia aquimarina TaxID=935700 RepID=A0A0D1EBQ7_9RHOB|nr:hypothetical protein jaqu_31140 [Jannaschia aquimarina]
MKLVLKSGTARFETRQLNFEWHEQLASLVFDFRNVACFSVAKVVASDFWVVAIVMKVLLGNHLIASRLQR